MKKITIGIGNLIIFTAAYFLSVTRKLSSRMRIARMRQMNKFEQVFSDAHQMSLAGGGAGLGRRSMHHASWVMVTW